MIRSEIQVKEYVHNHVHYEVAKRENGTEYAKEVSSVTINQAYSDGLKDGRPKWHKVADGDLPKVGVPVIGFYYGKDNWHKVYLRADGHWWGDGTLCQPPYAWQEIVPPEVM